MNFFEIAQHRFTNQQITDPQFSSYENLLHWMGAMQAQDYEMAKWALGVRLPGSTRDTVEKAIEDGSIIRTHVLRPTWHFVAAEDLRWMLKLTAPRIRTSMRSRQKQLGLTEDVVSKSNKIIEKILSDKKQMTRSDLVTELENAGLKNEDNRASHLLICAELDGVICSGPSHGKNYTYALFENRVPTGHKYNREEALAELAETYFLSHGPATPDDFIWWSGLTKTDARSALEAIKKDFISKEIGLQTYWFSGSPEIPKSKERSVHLLPAYDEFLISYSDRSATIRIEDQKKAISNNGIFRPVIVVDGEVAGIWKRSVKKETVYVETIFFTKPSKEMISQIEETAVTFSDFLEKDLKINHGIG